MRTARIFLGAVSIAALIASDVPAQAGDPPDFKIVIVKPTKPGGDWNTYSEFCAPSNTWTTAGNQEKKFVIAVEFVPPLLDSQYRACLAFGKPVHESVELKLEDVLRLPEVDRTCKSIPNEGGELELLIQTKPSGVGDGAVAICIDVFVVDANEDLVPSRLHSPCSLPIACRDHPPTGPSADLAKMAPDLNTTLIIGP